MRTLAVSSRFAWPPDRCMNILSRDSHNSKSFIVRSIRSCRFAGSMSNIEAWNFRIDDGLWRQKPLASWKAIPITSRTLVPSSTTSIPTTLAAPDVGFRIVQRIIKRVVLPEPFGSRITIISPSLTVKFRPRRASVFPYLLERLSVSTANKLRKREFVEMGDKNVEPAQLRFSAVFQCATSKECYQQAMHCSRHEIR